jgi:hypothetical protein
MEIGRQDGKAFCARAVCCDEAPWKMLADIGKWKTDSFYLTANMLVTEWRFINRIMMQG